MYSRRDCTAAKGTFRPRSVPPHLKPGADAHAGRPQPRSETVYAALKRDILRGVLLPGSPLRGEPSSLSELRTLWLVKSAGKLTAESFQRSRLCRHRTANNDLGSWCE